MYGTQDRPDMADLTPHGAGAPGLFPKARSWMWIDAGGLLHLLPLSYMRVGYINSNVLAAFWSM